MDIAGLGKLMAARRQSATLGDVLRNLAFYVVFYGGSMPLVFGAVLAAFLAPSAFRPVADSWSLWHRFCVAHLLGIRIETRGALPTGQYFVAYKHESFFEAIDLPQVVPAPGVFAKMELMRIPLWGRAAAAYGIVGIDRNQGAKTLRAMVTAARRLIAAGRPLAIFPEGTRVAHGARPPLLAGFAGLYKMLGLPVVPIAVNSGPLYHRRWKRRGTITILIGDPIPPGLARAEIEARVHDAINALNEPEAP
jgi:1-acyl-sn-glycerol-3-phosphate acyltransferase